MLPELDEVLTRVRVNTQFFRESGECLPSGLSGLQSGNPSVEGDGSSSPSGTRKSRVANPTIRERSLLLRSLDEQP